MEKRVKDFMRQLEALGNEQTKKTYLRHGAKEPLFGVTSGKLKPLAKKIKRDHELAMALYATGNYDAMYFAGMIADPIMMSKEDFELWMKTAYCNAIADYVVAVTLAESPLGQMLADEWIKSNQDIYKSAGWSCYQWLIGSRPDHEFNKDKLNKYLKDIEHSIHKQQNRVRYAMNNYIIAIGISYVPLHQAAMDCAIAIGQVKVDMGDTSCKTPSAVSSIQKAIDQNRIGFKRRSVRC